MLELHQLASMTSTDVKSSQHPVPTSQLIHSSTWQILIEHLFCGRHLPMSERAQEARKDTQIYSSRSPFYRWSIFCDIQGLQSFLNWGEGVKQSQNTLEFQTIPVSFNVLTGVHEETGVPIHFLSGILKITQSCKGGREKEMKSPQHRTKTKVSSHKESPGRNCWKLIISASSTQPAHLPSF